MYGTLKRNYHNHSLLRDSIYIGTGKIPGYLYVKGLPYLKVDADAGSVVHGELYQVNDLTLARLDRLEGYMESNPKQSFYKRVVVPYVVVESGTTVPSETVYAYEYNGNVYEEYLKKDGVYNG